MSAICFLILYCFLVQLNRNLYHHKANQTERSAWYFTLFSPTQNVPLNTTHTKTHTCTTAIHCELFYPANISCLVLDKHQSELLKPSQLISDANPGTT